MGNCYSFLFSERSVHFLYSIVAVLMDWILFIGSIKKNNSLVILYQRVK